LRVGAALQRRELRWTLPSQGSRAETTPTPGAGGGSRGTWVLPYAKAQALNLHLEETHRQQTQAAPSTGNGHFAIPAPDIWRFPRQNHLSNRIFKNDDDIQETAGTKAYRLNYKMRLGAGRSPIPLVLFWRRTFQARAQSWLDHGPALLRISKLGHCELVPRVRQY
jgi:hypothetical protein